MAIEKDIAIHGSRGVKSCVEYINDPDKCSDDDEISVDIGSVIEYSKNIVKTTVPGEKVMLTSGVLCNPMRASKDFGKSARKYSEVAGKGPMAGRGTGGTKLVKNRRTGETERVAKESVEAYHVIQSFPYVEGLDPKLVHKIGKEYAAAAFPGYQCVVSTHMNTDNLHNHIVVCAYKMDGSRKLPMNKKFRNQIRQINDELSVKYHLPILLENDHHHDIKRGEGEEYAKNAGVSFKEEIRQAIETALSKDFVTSWADYAAYMKSLGIDMRQTPKYVTYIKKYIDKDGNEKTRRCRDSKLGDKYMRITICDERGWTYPKESERTNYIGYLDGNYRYHASSRDKINKDERTGRLHLHVDRYDENGRRRTLLEITIIAAIKIIHYFWDKHRIKGDLSNDEPGKPVNWDYDKKINAMLEGLELARTLKIEDRQELKEKMSENGKRASVLAKELVSLEMAVTKATIAYDSLDKTSLKPEELAKYDKNFHELTAKYSSMKQELDNLRYEYSLMSKLKRAVSLAKDPILALGPDTHISNYPSGSVIETKRDKSQESNPSKPAKEHKNSLSDTGSLSH